MDTRRVAIATLMSDTNLLGKVPFGRLDELAAIPEFPPDVELAVKRRIAGLQIEKGSKVWRQVRHFFLELKALGTREKKDRVERRPSKKGPFGVVDGQVYFKKYIIANLIRGGKDYARDNELFLVEGAEPDLAQGILSGYRSSDMHFTPGQWACILEAAQDYVAEGVNMIMRKKK